MSKWGCRGDTKKRKGSYLFFAPEYHVIWARPPEYGKFYLSEYGDFCL